MRRLFLILLCLVMLSSTVSAADSADTEITDMTTDIQLLEDGSCTVTSNITVRFSGNDANFVIPLGVDADDYSIGIAAEVETINNVTCYILSGATAFSGQRNFSVTYRLPCQVTPEEGVQHLDLSVLASGFTCPINEWTFTVQFPAEFESMPELFSGYHGDTAFNDFNIQCANGVYTGTMLTRMQDHDSLRLLLDLPEGYFDLRNMPGKTKSVDQYIFLGFALLAILYWFFRLRNGIVVPKKRKLPPGHVTPGEIGYQLTCDSPDLAALVMHWADLGYITVRRQRNGRVILTQQMEMGNERRSIEVKLFATLFRKDGNCNVQSLRYRNAAKRMRQPFGYHCARRMFSSHSGSVKLYRVLGMFAAYAAGFLSLDMLLGAYSSRWILIPLLSGLVCVLSWLIQQGVISLLRRRWKKPLAWGLLSALILLIVANAGGSGTNMVFNIFLQVFIGATAMFGGKRSRGGRDILQHLLSFRSYLRGISGNEVRQELRMDSVFFYHMFPYAEAFGLGKRFAKRFGGIVLEPCDWLQDDGHSATTAEAFYETYTSIIATLRQEDAPNFLVTLIHGYVNKRKRIQARKAGRYAAPRKPRPRPVPEPAPAPAYVRPHRRVTEEYSSDYDDF